MTIKCKNCGCLFEQGQIHLTYVDYWEVCPVCGFPIKVKRSECRNVEPATCSKEKCINRED